jgi:hypothetical protein
MASACAAGLAVLACTIATIAVALGMMPPVNLLAWGYAVGLCGIFAALMLLREKIAGVPQRIGEWRTRRDQAAAVERMSGLHLAGPDRR